MLHMQLKRRTNRAILSAMLLSLVLAAEAVPAQAAGRAELAMDGKAVPSGTVVALPEGSVAAFSLKLTAAWVRAIPAGTARWHRRERSSGSPMARLSMRSRRLGSWASVLVCTSMGKRSWRSKLRQARHAPPAKRQDALRSRLNMEHGIPMADRGPVPILLTGRMPAKRWTPTMPIDVQHVAPPPSCKPGQRTGGSATDRADNPEESQNPQRRNRSPQNGLRFLLIMPSSTGRLIQPKSKGRGLPDG